MTIIKPFKGILYDKRSVGDVSKVITPPYDVISTQAQKRYYNTHPNNFIRVDFGKTSAKDNVIDNRYTRAKKFFEEWITKGVLVRDETPSIYIYAQQYLCDGRKRERIGFISLAKLEDDRTKGFLPHERTFAGPKEDRFKLMRETRANLSPIFSIVLDDNKKIIKALNGFIKKAHPALDVKFEGTRNRLWRVAEPSAIKKLSVLIRNKKALIADGHHRYEVALEFRDWMRRAGPAADSYDYVMMYFAPADKSGLTILPTHRMLEGISAADIAKKMDRINKFFDIISAKSAKEMFSLMNKKGKHAIGLYTGGRNYLCLYLRRNSARNLITSDHCACWRNLDVVLLHKLLLEEIFDLEGERGERAISFTRDPDVAFKWVNGAKKRAAFFLNPARLEDIIDIVRHGDRMPHKTTYFYPKPPSGLVINKLD